MTKDQLIAANNLNVEIQKRKEYEERLQKMLQKQDEYGEKNITSFRRSMLSI